MAIIDLHCDTLLRLDELKAGLGKNNLSVDIEKLKAANSAAQFMAMFVDLKKYDQPFNQTLKLINLFYRELEENSADIELADSWTSFQKIRDQGKIALFLTVEEGGVLEGNMNNLEKLYDLGVRLLTLTWNYPNEIGFPHCSPPNGKFPGLTLFGRQVVETMLKKGMIIDVSHLSDQGFYEVAELSSKASMPFVASHSNARSITHHTRNLTDEMIRTLSNSGGITGINFANIFLGSSPISLVADIITHIKHIYNIGGIDVIALGSDFDGIEPALEIEHIGQIHKLIDALDNAGFSDDNIEKICWLNAARVIKCVLK